MLDYKKTVEHFEQLIAKGGDLYLEGGIPSAGIGGNIYIAGGNGSTSGSVYLDGNGIFANPSLNTNTLKNWWAFLSHIN